MTSARNDNTVSAGHRPVRPRLEINLQLAADQETTSDSDDTENMLLMLDKLRQAKHLIAMSRERKRKRDVITDTMNSFFGDSNNTMQKCSRVCREKKKHLIAEGEKLRDDISSLIERFDRRIESLDKFVATQTIQLDEAERQIQDFKHNMRRNISESDDLLSSEVKMMSTQMEEKLEEIKRILLRISKKANKKDQYLKMLQQILNE